MHWTVRHLPVYPDQTLQWDKAILLFRSRTTLNGPTVQLLPLPAGPSSGATCTVVKAISPLLAQLSPTQQVVDTYLAHSLDMNRDFPGMDAPDASSWPAASVSQGPASAGREGGWEQAISELLASLASSQLQQLGACLEQFFQMLKVVSTGLVKGPGWKGEEGG